MADTNVSVFSGGAVPAALAKYGNEGNDDLTSGVRGSYSIISIRGSKWRIKHDGTEELVTNDEGEPMASLKLVIVKSNPAVSKNYYEGGWEDGSTDAPVCFSMDGIRPDVSSKNIQSSTCAACPKNVIGSKISDSGKKTKLCSDSRRIAVIPEGDFDNEVYGGPMLLRIPAGSLTNLAKYGKKMKARGFPYNTVITRISFDPETSHPKLDFNAVRPLTDTEAEELVALLGDSDFNDKLEAILAKDVPLAQPTEAKVDNEAIFETEATPAKANGFGKGAKEKPKAEAKATPKAESDVQEPKPEHVKDDSDDELDASLKGILDSLDNLD